MGLSSESRTRKGRRDNPMCCFQFQLPSEASPTFWSKLGYFDIFGDFLYGYPNELHVMHPRSPVSCLVSEKQLF